MFIFTPSRMRFSNPESQARLGLICPQAFLFLLGMLLSWQSPAFAQKTPIDPPIADRPVDFSNIVGKYDINVTADPTDVQVEQSILLRIRITGEGPEKYQPSRKFLRLFPDSWKNDFYLQEMLDKHEVKPETKTWLFVYRLKPKHAKVNAIDDIKLVYYDPNIRDKAKFVTKYANSIKLTVKPKRDKSEEKEIPLSAAPDSFFEHVETANVLARSSAPLSVSDLQLALIIALPPLACLVSVVAWRRYFPDETRRVIQIRGGAAVRALELVQAGSVSAWDAMRNYLHERFDFSIEDPTPAEISAFLKRRGFDLALCAQSQKFMQACDSGRFAAGADTEPEQLAGDAARLIQSLEADPCARG
jgi:hypothetical protein